MVNVENFRERGYIIVDNTFTDDDLINFRKTLHYIICNVLERAAKQHASLKDTLKAILSNDSAESCDKGLLALRYVDSSLVSMVQRFISRSPEFYTLCSSPAMKQALRSVLELPEHAPLYFLSNGIVFTNPNDSENKRSSNFELDWHQDTFFTIPRSPYVQFWGPALHHSHTDIGTLILCPGSHKDGYGKQRIHPELSFNHRFSMAPGEVDKYEPIPANLELGQMLIFHGQLIHASGQNTSQHVRTTLLGLCHNVSSEHCVPVSTEYRYYGQTPEAWFYDVYKDEKALSLTDQFAANPTGEPAGGV
jgi:hypothetical protein